MACTLNIARIGEYHNEEIVSAPNNIDYLAQSEFVAESNSGFLGMYACITNDKETGVIQYDHKIIDTEFRTFHKSLKEVVPNFKRKIIRKGKPTKISYLKHCPTCFSENHLWEPSVQFQPNSTKDLHACIRCGLPLLKFIGFEREDAFCSICAVMNLHDEKSHGRCCLHIMNRNTKKVFPSKGKCYCVFKGDYSICSFGKHKQAQFFKSKPILNNTQVIKLNVVLRFEYLKLIEPILGKKLFFSPKKHINGLKFSVNGNHSLEGLNLTSEERLIINNLTHFLTHFRNQRKIFETKDEFHYPKGFRLGKGSNCVLSEFDAVYANEFRTNLLDIATKLCQCFEKQMFIVTLIASTTKKKNQGDLKNVPAYSLERNSQLCKITPKLDTKKTTTTTTTGQKRKRPNNSSSTNDHLSKKMKITSK